MQFIKTTVVGGFFIVLPTALVVFLLSELVGMLDAIVVPLAEVLPAEKVGGIEVALLLALLAVGLLCFVAGLLSQTAVGARANDWFERVVLGRIPGYDLIRNLTSRFEPGQERTVALVRTGEGARVLGFVAEELDDGRVVVFVPFAPTPTVGMLYVADSDDVQRLDVSFASAVNSFMQWGVGAREFLR